MILSDHPDVIKDISKILFQHCHLEGSDGTEYYKRENSYLDRILLILMPGKACLYLSALCFLPSLKG